MISLRFRPCIDIHNGKVKQIVGGSLADRGDYAQDNYVSDFDGDYYAKIYRDAGLPGGHIILLNPKGSSWYEEDVRQARMALAAWPGGLMIGGGIHAGNASSFLEAGASHVIVTSWVFKDGRIHYDNLNRLVQEVGKDKIVLDLSCRRKGRDYYIVTDRWQKFTQVRLCPEVLDELSEYCDEYLIHAVDVEGKSAGIERDLACLLGSWEGIPTTYAGGIGSMEDLRLLKTLGRNRVDVTIGSALDLFGGSMNFREVLQVIKEPDAIMHDRQAEL